MPVRRAHRKSVLGCRTCKKRRVKCDLNRPECLNCTRLGRECGFRFLDPAPRSLVTVKQVNVAPPPPPPQFMPDPSFLDSFLEPLPPALRARFTQLIKYHATQTSGTITHNAAAQSTWCSLVPRLSSNHEFVSHGIVGLSALHQSHYVSSETERKTLQDIAAVQMNTGLASYRECVAHVTPENAAALYTFSTATTAFVLATTVEGCVPLLHSARNDSLSVDEYNSTIEKLAKETAKFMTCFRGVMVIIVPCWRVMVQGPMRPLLDRDWWPRPFPSSAQALEEDEKLHDLENLWMRPGRDYEYWFDTLIHALKDMRDAFALVSLLTVSDKPNDTIKGSRLLDWSSVFAWITKTPPGFIMLVEQRNPEAWIILAHYAILIFRAGDLWWTKGFADHLVSAAALVIGPSMHSWIEWPASIIGVDLSSYERRSK
ncbi:unnamed protein product [Periconia digitata]|uniref:Zn(2)-C6 fungal-type domain-containing protein n=1 Tax=Periconia digitata TaxID=1303443 RepID=A0A9W4UKJ3_9PLEO|nr:unnamed protein product [Periconia digitata]